MISEVKAFNIGFLESRCFQCFHHDLSLWTFFLYKGLDEVGIVSWKLLQVIFGASICYRLVHLDTKNAVCIRIDCENVFVVYIDIAVIFWVIDGLVIILLLLFLDFEARLLSAILINVLTRLISYQIFLAAILLHVRGQSLIRWVKNIFCHLVSL